MGQFDNPKSIVMLFTGAFLVSLGVIAFLNVELQSRSNSSSKIRNESLIDIIGKKVSQMLSSLKEKNSHRRLILYQIFVSENATRTPMRKLQYYTENTVPSREKGLPDLNETHHRLRHEKKARRASELRRQGKNASPFLTVEKPHKTAVVRGSNFFFDFTMNRTVGVYEKNASEVISKQKLADHQHCYTTNDVLEIIAVTCLVNFIFWFMIIFCVNIFTKNTMWKSQSSESLTSITSVSEDELSGPGSKPLQSLNYRNTVDCYVDSLNLHAKGERFETEIFVPEKSSETGKRKEKTFSIINWRRDKLIRFCNNSFDRNPVTDLEKNRGKKCIFQNKKEKNVNSFSMESLIF